MMVPLPHQYIHPYLLNFSEVDDLTYLTIEGENAIEFYTPEGRAKFVHLFVVVNFVQGIGLPIAPKMYFIDQIGETSFKIEGIRADQVQNLSVYGFDVNNTREKEYIPS